MTQQINTKFTIATDQGIHTLLMLTKSIALEKYANIIAQNALEAYINKHFNHKTLTEEVNSMSNQWLVVYADEEPAGYAKITSKGIIPHKLTGLRVIRIADFGVLEAYNHEPVITSLLDKCLSVCKNYDAIWLNEYVDNPFIETFTTQGFEIEKHDLKHDELPLDSVFLIKKKS